MGSWVSFLGKKLLKTSIDATEQRQPILLSSEIYRGSSYGAWHPLRVPRVSTVVDLTAALGWVGPNQSMRSPRAKPKALSLWHDPDYIDALLRAEERQDVTDKERAQFGLGTAMNPVFPEMYRRPATGAGASLLASELLANGGIVHHPGGGTHHGFPGRASGFCYLNDCMLAIKALRRAGLTRIAYIDLDAHHPDGVAYGVGQDPDVLLISLHEAGRWPRTGHLDEDGAGSHFNLPVAAGMGDDEALLAKDQVILPALQHFKPEVIVLQMGSDQLAGDPQSRQLWSMNAYLSILCDVLALGPERLLVLGGGGYNPWTVGRLWTAIWGTLNGQELPHALPKPAEDVLRAIPWDSPRARQAPDHWFTSLIDPPAPGPFRDQTRKDIAHLASRLRAWV